MISLHEPLISGNEWKYVKSCLNQGWVSSAGKFINTFEKKIAQYTGSKYAIACINGTSALQISLKLAGVNSGDEVIAPSMTFIAPINAIQYNGARPIFMDNDSYYTIDVDKTIEFLNKKTRTVINSNTKYKSTLTVNKKTGNKIAALIIVHVFGNAVNMDKLVEVCRKKNIALIEDAAESIGTFYLSGKYKNKHTGTIGKIGCLSFNGNKVITTGGGGMILTNDKNIAKNAKYLTTQAKDDPIYSIHNDVGYNFRLTNMQAALGTAQLESLSKFIKKKKIIHERYKYKLNKIKGLNISKVPYFARNNYWLNVLEINENLSKKKLSKIIKYLNRNGIETRPIWYPNHLQQKYKNCQTYKLKNINKIYHKRLCLPSSMKLTFKQQNFVCSKLESFFRK